MRTLRARRAPTPFVYCFFFLVQNDERAALRVPTLNHWHDLASLTTPECRGRARFYKDTSNVHRQCVRRGQLFGAFGLCNPFYDSDSERSAWYEQNMRFDLPLRNTYLGNAIKNLMRNHLKPSGKTWYMSSGMRSFS